MLTHEPPTLATSPEPLKPEARRILGRLGTTNLVPVIRVLVGVSVVLLGTSAMSIWTAYVGFKETIAKEFKLQQLSGEIVHLDEVLTMSARMAASTGNLDWEGRYRQYEPQLIEAIEQVQQISPSPRAKKRKTDAANLKLVEMENQAFDLVEQGKLQAALDLLLGNEYEAQKEIYSSGITKTLEKIALETEGQLNNYRQRLFISFIFAVLCVLILIPSWILIGIQIRRYVEERESIQKSFQSSQRDLLSLNREMESKTEQIVAREKQILLENELLQADIGNLLEIVSGLEQGDFTLEAEVSERATGLVADVLNRLTEELTRTIKQVLRTAQEVSKGMTELEQLAIATAQKAEKQAESVLEVEVLMENVNNISRNTAQQAITANQTMQEGQAAIFQGQQSMTKMTQGIAALQSGQEQITRRAETLVDFVALASQFVRDQKRVAALTRVLAFNASTIAQRASEQSNPEQFTTVVQEFKIIANQINDLATETNRGLQVLQQRTDQLQIVASGLNQDVQDINELVSQFTQGVNQSSGIFENIKKITEQLVEVEEQVTLSSQEIAIAAQTTLRSVTAIAGVAQVTREEALATREKSSTLGKLARQLLERVQFFRLKNK